MKHLLLGIIILFSFSSCTENLRAKQYGGSFTIKLAPGEKFVNATWKETNLWYITKRRQPEDSVYNSYIFHEDSQYGLMQGEVTFQETE